MDKAKLLAPRADTSSGMPEDSVEIPDVGTVRVRGMNREEILALQKRAGEGIAVLERISLSWCMVDPVLTEDEVAAWQKTAAAGEFEAVTVRVQELSGMSATALKEAYKRTRGGPNAGVRALPGDAAEDDGAATAA